jgi:thiol-disulfide isomerase/thioredoxin
LRLLPVIFAVLAAQAGIASALEDGAEARVVEYLKRHVKPGERVVVSQLYNEVFTAPEERAALDRLFNVFFKIPLFVAQYVQAAGKPPSLAEIAEQFRFEVPGQADLMLRIMEADPRMPRFLARSAQTGEIERVDVEAIRAHPRFGKPIERTIAGFEGRPAAPFSLAAYDGSTLASSDLASKPYLLYFWFSGCPPCVKTTPLLVELHEAYGVSGLEVVGVNADRVLGIPIEDSERAAYAERNRIRFRLAHLTPELQAAYGEVSVFPTFFLVDRAGTIVEHLVNFQDRAALEAAIRLALR